VQSFMDEFSSLSFLGRCRLTDCVVQLPQRPLIKDMEVRPREVVVNLGGSRAFKEAYRQLDYPVSATSGMNFSEIKAFIDRVIEEYDLSVTFIGSHLAGRRDFADIMLCAKEVNAEFKVPISDGLTCLTLSEAGFTLTALVLPGDDVGILEQCRPRHVEFYVDSQTSCERALAAVTKLGIGDCSLSAFHNGENAGFIAENVFLTEDELLSQRLTRQQLYIRGTVNPYYFGRFTVMPSGEVFTNPQMPPVGCIHDSVQELIAAEGENNYGWKHTRRMRRQCEFCIFVDVCPSPSPMEEYMKQGCIVHN